jgi:ribosomal protein S18 acetylase RimI-like enzyme
MLVGESLNGLEFELMYDQDKFIEETRTYIGPTLEQHGLTVDIFARSMIAVATNKLVGIILKNDNEPMAFAVIDDDGINIRLLLLVVLVEYRSQGYGSMMIRWLRDSYCKDKGCKFISVSVHDDGKGFYEKQGFYSTHGGEQVKFHKMVLSI